MSDHSLSASGPSGDRLAAIYRACIDDAVAESASLAGRLARAAREALMERQRTAGLPAERDAASGALRQLTEREREFTEALPAALRQAIQEGPQVPRPRSSGSGLELSFDQLELMDESEVQGRVELARAQQLALHAAEHALAELSPYICAAQGLPSVRPERNPLRPDIYIRALQDAVSRLAVAQVVRLAWLRPMYEVLGRELAVLYDREARRLAEAGIEPVGYAVVPPPGGLGRSVGGGFVHSVAPPVEPGDEALLTVGRLRQLLAGDYEAPYAAAARPDALLGTPSLLAGLSAALNPPPAGAAAAPPVDAGATTGAFPPTTPAAYDLLGDLDRIGEVVNRLAQRGMPVAPAGGARGAGQSLGVEVVALMTENIAQDERLLPGVRRAVKDLEPALMQLVLADPRFFSDRDHPARRLLDEMTQRSLAFDDEGTPGFKDFLTVLRGVVDRLAATPIADAQPFEEALAVLQQAWAVHDAEELARREQAVQELLHAEQRNLLAEKVAADIRSWPDAARVPPEVLAFATGPWSHVIAEARLADRVGTSDPGGYAAVVPNLFWSAQPELARAAIPRLTRLIPGLLSKLREGLKTIDYPAQQASAFFEQLIRLHQRAFQADGGVDRQSPPVPPARPAARPAAQPAAPVSAAAASVAAEESADAASATPAPVFALEVGAWVEIVDHGRPVRTQLTWTSPHGTLFLFTGADGSTRSMTRRMRDRLAAEGALRVVAGGTVVGGALDAVAQTALRNSIKPAKG